MSAPRDRQSAPRAAWREWSIATSPSRPRGQGLIQLELNQAPASFSCLSMISGQTLCVCPEREPVSTFPDHALALRLHAIDMFRARESAGANVLRIALNRGLDHRPEIAVAADEFRGPRRQPEHIFQHQHLTVAGGGGADAGGGNYNRPRNLPAPPV